MSNYYFGGKAYEPTGRICRRCKARVWKSDNSDYSYQCFECDEDFYEFETELLPDYTPKVLGTKEDGGLIGFGFCDEECPHCSMETYNIPIGLVSLCAHCGAELFPCAGCEDFNVDDNCQWSGADDACQRFSHTGN